MVWKDWIKEIFRPSEKKFFEKVNLLLGLSYQGTELILNFEGENLDELTNKVNRIEREGDEISRNLEVEVSTGTLTPSLLEDFKRLIELCDDVIDKLQFIAREMNRGSSYMKLKGDIESKVYSLIKDMLNKGQEANIKVRRLLSSLAISLEEAQKLAREIEVIEEEVDEIKNYTIDLIYSSPKDFLTFHHLLQLTIASESILDVYEDIADLSISIMKSLSS